MTAAWFALAGALGGGALGYTGAVIAAMVNRRGLKDLDRWREETMRLLRWASELAICGDEAKSYLGVEALRALYGSAMLQPDDREFLTTVTDAVVPEVEAYRRLGGSGVLDDDQAEGAGHA